MSQFFKKCWIILASLIIIVAILFSLFRAITPWAKQYKKNIEHHLSRLLSKQVTIKKMETGWYWFEPVIKLKQVVIVDNNKEILKLDKLLLGINLFSSLWHWQIQPGILFVDGMQLNLTQTSSGWQLDGFSTTQTNMLTNIAVNSRTMQFILLWILQQQKIIFRNILLNIHLKNGNLIPLQAFNLSIIRHGNNFNIIGTTAMKQKVATQFEIIGKLNLGSYSLEDLTGQIYFLAQDLLPIQWQYLLPDNLYPIVAGKGKIQLWLDITHGKLAQLHTKLKFNNLTFATANHKHNGKYFIPDLQAHLAWTLLPHGWKLAGDNIIFSLNGIVWPKNELLIQYNDEQASNFIYIKNLVLQSLLSLPIPWPLTINNILLTEPSGALHDTQIRFDNNGINYLLTRFAHLTWHKVKNIPGVSNLTGVLHWEPKEGRLEIAGRDTEINFSQLIPITFPAFHATIDWKDLDLGFRISVEHLLIHHPNLLLSIEGVVDEVTHNSIGPLRLQGQFSANNMEKLLPYLPHGILKPGLEEWLRKDVQAIKQASGEININGNPADFPFDNNSGNFSIRSYLAGVDLRFAPMWPVVHNIAGYLNFDKRDLTANIIQAELWKDIGIKAVNLSVNNLGSDQEKLLVQAKTEANASQALAYIHASPLVNRLAILDKLPMTGPLALALQLDIPLYTDKIDIGVLGDINFFNNTIKINRFLSNLQLNKVNGLINFDQNGIVDGTLTANLFNNPINLAIQPRTDSNATVVKMTGKTNITSLESLSPLIKFLHGSTWLEILLTLTHNSAELENLHINSNLNGLSVDLPRPLGKNAQTSVPLNINVDFKKADSIKLHLDYAQRVVSDLWFTNDNSMKFMHGNLVFGHYNLPKQQEKSAHHGLHLLGTLNNFNLSQWLNVKKQYHQENNSAVGSLLDVIEYVNIKLEQANFWNYDFNNLLLKAIKVEPNIWEINLQQKDVIANLQYNLSHNNISGVFNKLHFTEASAASFTADNNFFTKFKLADLPNFDICIGTLQWGAFDIGELCLKTAMYDKTWQIDQCKIKSPDYQVTAKINWQEDKLSKTRVDATMDIYNLARSLERFNINPVVESNQGKIRFIGGWNGPIYNFALAKINGEVGMRLKNGRITHFSPETEEKLGLGKLLSILSLQTIPRRLKLDFSDLSNNGYSFDEFNGIFTIKDGVMITHNSYIDGPVAYGSIRGKLDISKQYYDLDLKVTPHITASLPVVATIAGGPIAGMATWVASKIINQGMQKISSYTYKITGPWQQPVVQQVKIVKKKVS